MELGEGMRADVAKESRKEGTLPWGNLAGILEGELTSLYGSYEKAFREWENSESAKAGDPAPVFIVGCSNTTVSKMGYDHISGWEKPVGKEKTFLVPGNLASSSNIQNGHGLHHPRTILVQPYQLRSG